MTFILSDQSVNSYGFWVLTAGILLEQFIKNPVMLYDHERYGVMPIGKWTNIRVEENKLLADAEFDADDELAMKIKAKVEKGYLRGASIGMEVRELSDQPEYIQQGQTHATVIKAFLLEASITPFPSNRNSLKLSANGKKINLSESSELNNFIPTLNNNQKMKKVAILLGLAENADENQIAAAVEKQALSIKTLTEQRNKTLITLGTQSGFVTNENKAKIEKLADVEFDLVFELAQKSTEKTETDPNADNKQKTEKSENVRFSDILEGVKNLKNTTTKTFRELADSEPQTLSKLFTEDFAKFNELYKAEYGKEYAK